MPLYTNDKIDMKNLKILYVFLIGLSLFQGFCQGSIGEIPKNNPAQDGWSEDTPTKLDSVSYQVVNATDDFAIVKVIEKNMPIVWQVITCVKTQFIPTKADYICKEMGAIQELNYAVYAVGKALIEMKLEYLRKGNTASVPWIVDKSKVLSSVSINTNSYEEALEVGSLLQKYKEDACMPYQVPEVYGEKKIAIGN